MNKVAHLLDSEGVRGLGVLIFCPACKYGHMFQVKKTEGRPLWKWNGSLEKPTFTPSMLVFGSSTKDPKYRSTPRCHSFVTDGKIRFLSDCTHSMAGKTVDLQPF